jgi:hypothetical protein
MTATLGACKIEDAECWVMFDKNGSEIECRGIDHAIPRPICKKNILILLVDHLNRMDSAKEQAKREKEAIREKARIKEQ